MKLTVLGCSGSMPGPDSPAAGYLVEHEGFRVVLDLGNGAFGALQRHVAPTEVDAIVLSHLHADHCIDLTSYYVDLRYGPDRPRRRIRLIGPAGTRDRLAAAYDPLARKLDLQQWFDFGTPANGELGPFAVAFAPVNHPVPAYAIRLSVDGRSLAYSGDTGESADLVALAGEADLFLCEATFAADEPYVPDLHLTGQQAGEHAAKAGAKRLVVTHVPPWGSRDVAVAEAAAGFGAPVEAASPGAVFEV
ncbi:MAG: MBL fold metallo-hydrolase [Actinobacteria bacterium]|nr:MBL fold metallo-hydrolase [Actinomycetota bacterium]